MAEDSDERQAFHIEEDPLQPVGPGHDSPLAASFDPTRLDFGHYAGSTIEELASVDPDYLRWLERHPSGVRYRAEIHRVLGVVPYSTDWHR
ncbi:MAG: exodeoxyribonuclease X C-terminal domain-containing protein [Candidatus Limnocylindria bacterium]